MTTKMRRSLKSNENRPNFAKRAKDFGLEYISIANIKKYFKEDWEKIIESEEQRFNWQYISRSLIRRDLMDMRLKKSDIMRELQREGLPNAERRKLQMEYSAREYHRRSCERTHQINQAIITIKKVRIRFNEVRIRFNEERIRFNEEIIRPTEETIRSNEEGIRELDLMERELDLMKRRLFSERID